MRFRSWNVTRLYRAGTLKTVASETGKCNLDLMAVQEFRWDKSGSQPADDYTCFYGNGTANQAALKWVEFISERMSYIRPGHEADH
jgi:hypothetical protein